MPLHCFELFGADFLKASVVMASMQLPAEENAQMFGLKAAFDPQDMLNPGKAIPTLSRCVEYGKMLVCGEQIKHPNLPRF